jgi:hypothetical protein
MRRDFYLENDSGGLSVLSVAAARKVVAEAVQHGGLAGDPHGGLLLELYGDDAMPVRVVVDEPLTADEESQWLGRVRHSIDAPDGRLLVCGGFDADVIGAWLKDEDAASEGRDGVALIEVTPGRWRADLYAHVGSTNGRQLLGDEAGAWFRRDHPGRPFPLWLVSLLRFSGEEDPGHEETWKRPDEKIRAGEIPVDLQSRGFVGFLLHLHKGKGKRDEPQNGDWFELETGARKPKRFPVGLPSSVEDANLANLARDILQEKPPAAPLPAARQPMDVLTEWPDAPLHRLDATVELPLKDLEHAYLVPFLANEGTPGLELRIRRAGSWSPPAAEADWVAVPHDGGFRAGPPPNWGGWPMLAAVRKAAAHLASLPSGAELEMATRDLENPKNRAGRIWLSGEVRDGTWRITASSPAVPAPTLADALAYVRDMREAGRISARGTDEVRRLKKTLKQMELFVDRKNPPRLEGEVLDIGHEDVPGRVMLAGPLFCERYAGVWGPGRGRGRGAV